MRAVVYEEVRGRLSVREVPAPACPRDGVVVQVMATGVCRSDWHAWQGHDPVRLPNIPGHELAGVVAEVGEDVRQFLPGERVTVPFVSGCGRCAYCRMGETQVCPQQTQPGFTGPGSFAEYVALPAADTNLVRLPAELDQRSAAILGCRFATAYRALTAHARVQPEEWVVVHGCGGLGLSAVAIATALGARVIAVDVSPAALRQATALGAAETVLSTDPVDDVRRLSDGGADVSLDALGSPATAVASVRSLRRRGRHVQVGLLLGAASTPPLPMDLVIAHELAIFGSHGMPARDYPAMLAMLATGRVPLERLVTRLIGLDGAPEALMALGRPAQLGGITLIEPGGGGRSG